MKIAVKRGDIIVIAVIVLLAIGIWLFMRPGASGSGRSAEIYVDGEFYRSVPLGEGREELVLKSDEGENVLLVEDGSVSIISADCPTQECVRSGIHSSAGDTIACLPNRILVKLSGGDGNEPDGIAY